MKLLICWLLCVSSLLAQYSGRRVQTTGSSEAVVSVGDYNFSTAPGGGSLSFSYSYRITPLSPSASTTASASVSNFSIFSQSANTTSTVKSGAGAATFTGTSATPVVWQNVDSNNVAFSLNVNQKVYTVQVPRVKPPSKSKFYVNLRGGKVGTKYTILQNGNEVGSTFVRAGDGTSFVVDSWSNGVIEVLQHENTFTKSDDGSLWYVNPSDNFTSVALNPSPVPNDATQSIDGGGGSNSVPPGFDPETFDENVMRYTEDGRGLSEVAFFQGVQKIVDAVKGQGSDGGAVGNDPVNNKLSEISDKLTVQDEMAKKAKAAEEAKPPLASMLSQGNAAAADAKAAFGEVPQVAASPVAPSAPSTFLLELLPGRFFDVNPFDDGFWADGLAWLKILIAWILVVRQGAWAVGEARAHIHAMMGTPQTRGNTVAGTGGQITALIAAAAIAVAVNLALPVTATFLTTEFGGVFTVGEALILNPFQGTGVTVQGALYFLFTTFPVAVWLSCMVSRVTWTWTLVLVSLGVQTFIKFVVP